MWKGGFSMLNANQRKHKGEISSSSFLSSAEGQVEVSQAKKRAKKITSRPGDNFKYSGSSGR